MISLLPHPLATVMWRRGGAFAAGEDLYPMGAWTSGRDRAIHAAGAEIGGREQGLQKG
jgi:hypothetical protein